MKRQYRWLFSPKRRGKPGPTGPSPELIAAIVETKRLNSSWGCRRIAQQLCIAFGIEIDKDVVRRVLAKRYRLDPGAYGPSWPTVLGHSKDCLWSVDGPSLCRMFNHAICGAGSSEYISSDNDPLFRFHRWKANFRILEVTEVKTVPYLPISHPFAERLIGTIRREYFDLVPFWNARDLESKPISFKDFYNDQRCHYALDGDTPSQKTGKNRPKVADLDSNRWQSHCRGLYRLPVAVSIPMRHRQGTSLN